MTTRIRRINFIYDSSYFQTLANTSAFLEEQGFKPNEDFAFGDSGHLLRIDGNAHFAIKESPEWWELLIQYEQVGYVSIERLQ